MEDPLRVTVFDGRDELEGQASDERVVASEDRSGHVQGEQIAASAVVHNEVDIIRVVKNRFPECDDVGVGREGLMYRGL